MNFCCYSYFSLHHYLQVETIIIYDHDNEDLQQSLLQMMSANHLNYQNSPERGLGWIKGPNSMEGF